MSAAPTPHRHDVLVVGGGPAGAATGYWLAEAGHDVVVVEKKTFPREKTCGDGLTPRAVKQLADMGLERPRSSRLPPLRRAAGRRPRHHPRAAVARRTRSTRPRLRGAPPRPRPARGRARRRAPAPRSARAPRRVAPAPRATASSRGAVVKDKETGRRRARSRPATWWSPTAPTPASAGPSAPPATATYPQGMAIRGYYESPLHDDPWIESRPRRPRPQRQRRCPATAGSSRSATAPSTSASACCPPSGTGKSVNTTHLMDECAATAPEHWGIDPDAMPARPPAAGSRWAARSTPRSAPPGSCRRRRRLGQPVQRRGHRLRLRDRPHGRRPARRGPDRPATAMAAASATRSCSRRSTASTSRWPASSPRSSASPALMRELTRVGMQSRTLMEWVLRIMANLLRPDELGPAEAAYKAVASSPASSPNASPPSAERVSGRQPVSRSTGSVDRRRGRLVGDADGHAGGLVGGEQLADPRQDPHATWARARGTGTGRR